MIWNLLENRANTAMHYTSSIGRIWIINQFLFRMLIVTVIGSQVFGDEQGKFLCDTDQPGCKNICFNRFSPISYLRLWAFQVLIFSWNIKINSKFRLSPLQCQNSYFTRILIWSKKFSFYPKNKKRTQPRNSSKPNKTTMKANSSTFYHM